MSVPASQILLSALLPTGAMIGAGALATWRAPGPKLRSGILHFAAGVVFSVVAVEILPDVVKGHAPVQTVIGFTLGLALMLGLRVVTHGAEPSEPKIDEQSPAVLPWGLLGVGVDIAIDGLLLGIAFVAGAKEGFLLTLALTIEIFSLGFLLFLILGMMG